MIFLWNDYPFELEFNFILFIKIIIIDIKY